jgi:hypothetical protein
MGNFVSGIGFWQNSLKHDTNDLLCGSATIALAESSLSSYYALIERTVMLWVVVLFILLVA